MNVEIHRLKMGVINSLPIPDNFTRLWNRFLLGDSISKTWGEGQMWIIKKHANYWRKKKENCEKLENSLADTGALFGIATVQSKCKDVANAKAYITQRSAFWNTCARLEFGTHWQDMIK